MFVAFFCLLCIVIMYRELFLFNVQNTSRTSGGLLKENNIHSSDITGRRPHGVHLVKNLSKSLAAFQGIVRLLVLGALIPPVFLVVRAPGGVGHDLLLCQVW